MLSYIATIKYNIALTINSVLTIQPVHESPERCSDNAGSVFSGELNRKKDPQTVGWI